MAAMASSISACVAASNWAGLACAGALDASGTGEPLACGSMAWGWGVGFDDEELVGSMGTIDKREVIGDEARVGIRSGSGRDRQSGCFGLRCQPSDSSIVRGLRPHEKMGEVVYAL